MGNRLTDGEEQTESRSYGDIFDEMFPHYLVMGMTPEQYWDGESELKKAFRKAYELRTKIERQEADRNNWYMGQYIIDVLQSVPLLVGGLNVKKGAQLPEYPHEPYLLKQEAEKNKAVRRKREEDQTRLAMAMFQTGIEKFNRNIQKRQEAEAKAAESGQ